MKIRKSIIYQRCEDLTELLVEQRYTVITNFDLEYLLKRYVGADPRTIRAYKEHLVEFNFLKPSKEGYEVLRTWIPVQKRLEAVAESK